MFASRFLSQQQQKNIWTDILQMIKLFFDNLSASNQDIL